MELNGNRSYRLRGSRITQAQSRARASLAPKYEITERSLLNPQSYFPQSSRIIMEIGFGMGEATAQIADAQKSDGFIAVEVHPPGVGKLMARLEERELSNVKIINEDVHTVLKEMIPPSSLDGVHLFFPDPWPKVKHHKRRIINEDFLALVAPTLKAGGFIHIATDWVPYADAIKRTFAASTLFTGGEVERPSWRPITRFEGQGISKDHLVTDLHYVKN